MRCLLFTAALCFFSFYSVNAQNMVSVECIGDGDSSCKWYVINKHDKPVKATIKKTFYLCLGDIKKETKEIRVKAGGKIYLNHKKNVCMHESKKSYRVYSLVSVKYSS
ncbi:hypothetical protein [Maribacter litoralis]|uniref:hypothetical protein n=1 Tax=Maribacter litoralis TaxID=2059726 RepID=UPI003D27CBD6